MNKFLKNTSGSTIVRMGQVLSVDEVYEVEKFELGFWQRDDEVKADLANGNLTVVKNISGDSPKDPYVGEVEFQTIDEEENLILLDHDGQILTDQNFNVITGAK